MMLLKLLSGQLGMPPVEARPVAVYPAPPDAKCRKCGCTNEDCHGCIERASTPCHWIEADLCSACRPATWVAPGLHVSEHLSKSPHFIRTPDGLYVPPSTWRQIVAVHHDPELVALLLEGETVLDLERMVEPEGSVAI